MTEHRPVAYRHEDTISGDRSHWMAGLGDDLHLSQISMPGTHDSLSMFGGLAVQCQSVPLDGQLKAGIRAVDVRCRHISDVFSIHHGMVYQQINFGGVLRIVRDFLKANPSETVYMRVKPEHKPADNTREFEDTFREKYWKPNKTLFWDPATSACKQDPTLKETRGKLVVLQNFDSKVLYGVKYRCGQVKTQDFYNLVTNWVLYEKWTYVKKHLDAANKAGRDSGKLFISYLSGSGGAFPYFVASGQATNATDSMRLPTGRMAFMTAKTTYPDFPRLNGFVVFEGTNYLAAQRIGKGKEFSKHVGIVYADFPGEDLIDAVISLNF